MTELKKAEILSTFNAFWETWAERKRKKGTIDDLLPFFDKDVTAIGTGEHEKGRNYLEVIQNFKDDFNELEVPIQTNFFYQNVKLITPNVGLVEAECILKIEMEDGSILRFHLRFSTTFVFKNNNWLVIHNHVSTPSDGQSVGEAYPIDELKAKNDRLQKEVSERTKKLQERTVQLQQEKEKTESLLYNILPKVVAKELIETGQTLPARYENASVLFTDFVQFTRLAADISPKELVKELNDIFKYFDEIIKSEQLEKIKTIGDSYMAVCGLPEQNSNHAIQCVRAAKEMLQFLEDRNRQTGLQWKMRVGIHSGPVVAGVVGNHKFTYDLWGNTVNLASRMEGAGEEGKVNISEQTYSLVKDDWNCFYRGPIKVKGAKEINMYFVE